MSSKFEVNSKNVAIERVTSVLPLLSHPVSTRSRCPVNRSRALRGVAPCSNVNVTCTGWKSIYNSVRKSAGSAMSAFSVHGVSIPTILGSLMLMCIIIISISMFSQVNNCCPSVDDTPCFSVMYTSITSESMCLNVRVDRWSRATLSSELRLLSSKCDVGD